ncbi:hypothetical protein CSCA_5243 [Clostridium scatologenes]|uniref:Uncharacterized protein n=1 Tax=Clostridium scatologenes TaxID=1548 RepID=A0A0E3K5M2_CLOSL|nr:hypothetical protein CSCA_5243 [Clostridium scatologenes]
MKALVNYFDFKMNLEVEGESEKLYLQYISMKITDTDFVVCCTNRKDL